MLHRAATKAYSWWWASHIRTKQSKWLDQNLQDMEEKVEHILKIIEEDGDSFAQRAEMYYRRRPELLNFVEDFFRGYRALAEKYDHISKELQSANRTIATVYPEQVQLAMDEENETSPTSSTRSINTPQHFKNLPSAPKFSIPKNTASQVKKAKAPSRLMSKNGLLKFNMPDSGPDPKTGMGKEEALAKIDEIQKIILSLQTEKEFVQTLYENGLEKYWEIEGKINDLQSKVNNLQDEHGIGTFIEDDEARTVMAATALKTCQETLIRLQDKQNRSDEEARMEYEKVKEVHKKLVIFKENLAGHAKKDGVLRENLELEEKIGSMLENENDIEKFSEKVNEQIAADSSTSVTMSEMAEKIDDLVEKVITLETALSSQNALLTKLTSETNVLQTQIESIEQDKKDPVEESNSKNEKIVELERELLRVKNLNQKFKNENCNLQRCLTEASFTVGHLTEKLKSTKQDEDIENLAPGTAMENGPRAVLQDDRCMISQDQDLEISKIKGIGEAFETNNVTDEGGLSKDGENCVHDDSNNCFHDLLQSSKAMSDAWEPLVDEKKMGSTGLDYPALKVAQDNFSSFNPFDDNNGSKETGKSDRCENQDLQLNTKDSSEYLLVETQTLAAKEVDQQSLNKEHKSAIEIDNDSTFSEEAITKERKCEDFIALVATGQDERFVKASSSNPLDSLAAPSNDKLTSEHGKSIKEESNNDVSDQVKKVNDQQGEKQIQSEPSFRAYIPEKVGKDQNVPSKEHESDEDDQPDWKELFLNGMEDREKVLLEQYTATMRNYKGLRKQLNEMEKKNHESVSKSESQIKELKYENASKDAEIKSLHRKLDLLQGCLDENPETTSTDSPNQHLMKEEPSTQAFSFPVPSLDQNQTHGLLNEQTDESVQRKEVEGAEQTNMSPEKSKQGENCVIFTDQPDLKSAVEEKFRSDIDGLLEENIEFWMRFTTSCQQIQKFQTSVEDLQDELMKLREIKKQEGSSKQKRSSNSDIRPIYNHLKEIQTELTLWAEQNSLLEIDLQHRLTSLSRLHGEISSKNVENAESGMSDYQAAKFQGEIMNMTQENNQVAQKLQFGLKQVNQLQNEIEKTISDLEEQLGLTAKTNQKGDQSWSSRSKIPLRSKLFGAKMKKPKNSLFHCINPTLQKQYSDMQSAPK